ncbi:MAG: S41 family peptidase [Rhizobacter sp.]|nr:S41 family peptidase [Bacteriovorax sp.]
MKRVLLSLLLCLSVHSSVMAAAATPAPAAPVQADEAAKKSRYEKLELFNKVLYLIESQYYREVSTEKLIEGAINGMMNTLDPHSAYLDSEVFSKMQEETSGEFGGLGIEVTQKDGVLVIITPIEDSPAWKAGVKAGDRVVEINHESMVGATLQQAIDKLRGKMKSKIILGIVREGVDGITNYEMTREVVYLKPVKYELLQNGYAYVRLTQFQKKSAEYIADALKKMRADLKNKATLKGVVLDLRSNPGGLLDEAVDVSSIFLKDGIVVSTESRDPKNKEIRYVKKTGYKELDVPLVVLINGSSASASEIVSGALQDSKRAIIMGTQSFGKGSVQSVAKIDETSGVKLTIAQYMTPNNRKIQAVGITPDVTISEAEGEWYDANKKESSFIREKDLKNHLTATIETTEEARLREEQELKERIERTARYKAFREKKKLAGKKPEAPKEKLGNDDDDDDNSKKVDPKEDYQVNQAINYLKNISLIKNLKF